MKKVSRLFYRLCLYATLLLCGFILMLSVVTMNHGKDIFTGQYGRIGQICVPLCSSILFIVVLLLVYQQTDKIRYKKTWIVPTISFIAILLLQILYLCFVSRPAATTDAARVMNEALAMLEEQHGQLNMEQTYFQNYPNNHFIVLFFYYFYLMLQKIGIINFWLPTIALNVLCIDAGILVTYFSVKKLLDEKAANYFLWLCMFCPTTYVWLTFAYTNTFSIPFVMLCIYLYLRIKQSERNKKTILLCILFGCCIFLGCMIRFTTVIPVIAIAMYHIICFFKQNCIVQQKDRKIIGRGKNSSFVKLGIVIVTVFLLFCGYKEVKDQHIVDLYKENQFPITHWIMMGTKNYGEYNEKDVAFTNSFLTQKEKKIATTKMIKKRLSKLGLVGSAKLVGKKIAFVWALGADDAIDKGKSAYEYPVLYKYFMGNRNGWFIVYLQMFRLVTFLFVCISVWNQIGKKEFQPIYIYMLTLLGAILFFIIWEANCKYNICFQYLCMLLMADGIRVLSQNLQLEKEHKVCKKKFMISAVILVFIFDLFAWYIGKGIEGERNTDYQYQYFVEGNNTSSIINLDNQPNIVEQTIQVRKFSKETKQNRIRLFFDIDRKLKTEKREYRIEVFSNPSQEMIYTKEIGKKDLEKNASYCVRLPEQKNVNKVENYMIRMIHIGKKYAITPKIVNLSKIDTYPYGELWVNNKKVSYDLYFHVIRMF